MLSSVENIPKPPPSTLKDPATFKEFLMDSVDYYTLRSTTKSPPRGLEVPPTLVCRAFQQFIAHLKSPNTPSAVFVSLANKLAAELSFCYTELETNICLRVRNILTNMNLWGGCSLAPVQFQRQGVDSGRPCETDISFCCNGRIDMHHCVATLEFKKDVSDANREGIGYFVHMGGNKWFLISLYDCHCDVLGAIRIKKDGKDHFVISPLAESVNFFLHPDDEVRCDQVLLDFAKLLEALSVGIECLVVGEFSEYADTPDLFNILPEVRCDGELVKFHERLGSLVFRGVCTTSNKAVVVKFYVRKYGVEVHRFLCTKGYAPDIHCQQEVGPIWSACVMSYVPGKSLFHHLQNKSLTTEAKEYVSQQLSNIRSLLEQGRNVHGDLHSNNIIVTSENKLFVVDFSWAGESEMVSYPYSLNMSINWHSSVQPGAKIVPEHDAYLIENVITELNAEDAAACVTTTSL